MMDLEDTTVPMQDDDLEDSTVIVPQKKNSNPLALTLVSQQYDRDGKGYLDETEQKLRKLDKENTGRVSVDKVYGIMEQLQQEQKKSMSLKKMVIALSCFAFLLAIANIGTSFTAAKLAQDTNVNAAGDFVSKETGMRLSTRSATDVFEVQEGGRENSRFLQDDVNVTLSKKGFITYSTILRTDAIKIFSLEAVDLHSW
jgi:hypothetical protein